MTFLANAYVDSRQKTVIIGREHAACVTPRSPGVGQDKSDLFSRMTEAVKVVGSLVEVTKRAHISGATVAQDGMAEARRISFEKAPNEPARGVDVNVSYLGSHEQI